MKISPIGYSKSINGLYFIVMLRPFKVLILADFDTETAIIKKITPFVKERKKKSFKLNRANKEKSALLKIKDRFEQQHDFKLDYN